MEVLQVLPREESIALEVILDFGYEQQIHLFLNFQKLFKNELAPDHEGLAPRLQILEILGASNNPQALPPLQSS